MLVKDDEDSKPQETEKPRTQDPKPNPNIKPPVYDIVTEGYDPSRVKRQDRTAEEKK